MSEQFVRLRLRGGEHDSRDSSRAVNLAQVVSIRPIFSEADKDPMSEPGPISFYKTLPKDDVETLVDGVWHHFEVLDSLGNTYWSDIGDNAANRLLEGLYK